MLKKCLPIILASYALAACGTARFAGGSGKKNNPVQTDTPPVTNPPPTSTPPTTTQINDKEVEFGSDKVFHIGDNDFGQSSCRREIKAFDLHGTKYFFEFEVTQATTKIDISIRRVCGVDYDDTNFVRILKNGTEISQQLLQPAATQFTVNTQTLEPGKYAIVVESLKHGTDNDDFLVGNIYLKADKAIVGGNVRAE